MVDLVSSLVLSAFVVSVALGWVLFGLLPARAHNHRLDGHAGILLGHGLMEVAYRMFEPLLRVLVALRVTPNMVTAFSLLPALVSAVLVAMGHFGLGALLATASGFCDMVDGMLARHYNSMSDAGGLFDAAVDRYGEYFLLAGLAVYFRGSLVGLVLCLGAVLGSFMVSYGSAKAEALGIEPPKGAMRRAERAVYVISGCGVAPLWELVVPGERTFSAIAYGRELPVELALLIVALVANVSAVRRMLRVAELARAKRAAG
ncbi:MAG: CDP-alcohol phosphatidyltransferase family protein [Deltaproteobacteria bacterium]|jgi:CDP-diacylglycerol--glycerol-3-phosphate 3-phosphatidyltransferase|nr:CDP-alcohol phosphatidyltransferase family protein [Deltaproteobacteria bacterium]